MDLVAEMPSGEEPLELDSISTDSPRIGPDAVEVYRARSDIEAEMLRSLLEDAGITAVVFREGLGAIYPGARAQTRVMVARDQAEAAIAVIRAAQQGDNALTELDEIDPDD